MHISSILLVFCAILGNLNFEPKLVINPSNKCKTTPKELNLKFTEQQILTTDNILLNSWLIKPESKKLYKQKGKTTLIVAYGDSGNMSHWLGVAKLLSQNGYQVFLFDYRGYGKNKIDPELDKKLLYFNEIGTDLSAAINWCKQNTKHRKLGILSYSMGTIAATLALQDNSVDFLLAEGFVYNPLEIQERVYEAKDRIVKLPNEAELLPSKIKKLDLPMLLFAGEQDKTTTLKDSGLIVNQQDNRQLISFNGNHMQGMKTLGFEKYWEYIEAFINKIN